MVTVMRGGEEVKISKRAGSYVTVRDLVDGWAAMRCGTSSSCGRATRSSSSTSISRARSRRRTRSTTSRWRTRGMSGIFRVGGIDPAAIDRRRRRFDVLVEPEEQELIKACSTFPRWWQGAAEALEPHRVAAYLHDTARRHAPLVPQASRPRTSPSRSCARGSCSRAPRRSCCGTDSRILGITAPERM